MKMYTFDSRVRYSELDNEGKLSIHGLVNYLQDCSSFQSESLRHGVEYLKAQHRGWWLASWQLEILERPKLGDLIKIGTFPYEFKGFYGMRNFFIQDEGGHYLVKANSIWTYVNTDTGHPAKASREEVEAYGQEPRLDMDYYGRKIEVPKNIPAERRDPFPVRRYHIDTNRHMNNSYYPAIAWEYLPEGFRCRKMQVEYKAAAVFGNMIYPSVMGDGSQYWVLLSDADGKAYAVAHMEQ